MKTVKSLYYIITLIMLMIVRPFASGNWFGSIVLAGLFTAWLSLLNTVWSDNLHLVSQKAKSRYAIIMLSISIIGVIILIFAILNLILSISWLNQPIVLDEITLFTLLISLEQKTIVSILNKTIGEEGER